MHFVLARLFNPKKRKQYNFSTNADVQDSKKRNSSIDEDNEIDVLSNVNDQLLNDDDKK